MFKVGTRVRWTSQAAGYSTTKEGLIEEVVAAGARPPISGAGLSRKHESYIVRVPKKGRYWPLVSKLKVVDDTEQNTGA